MVPVSGATAAAAGRAADWRNDEWRGGRALARLDRTAGSAGAPRGGCPHCGYALAFFGLLLAGAVLLVVVVAPAVLAALGLGQFLKYQLNHGLAFDGQDARDLFGLLLGLACCRFVLPAALLAMRRLAMLTRRLSARVVRGGHRRGVRAEAGSRQRRAAAVSATSSG